MKTSITKPTRFSFIFLTLLSVSCLSHSAYATIGYHVGSFNSTTGKWDAESLTTYNGGVYDGLLDFSRPSSTSYFLFENNEIGVNSTSRNPRCYGPGDGTLPSSEVGGLSKGLLGDHPENTDTHDSSGSHPLRSHRSLSNGCCVCRHDRGEL